MNGHAQHHLDQLVRLLHDAASAAWAETDGPSTGFHQEALGLGIELARDQAAVTLAVEQRGHRRDPVHREEPPSDADPGLGVGASSTSQVLVLLRAAEATALALVQDDVSSRRFARLHLDVVDLLRAASGHDV